MTTELRATHHERAQHDGVPVASYLLVGGLCGLAWAAGLRGLMAEVAGSASSVTWSGTFGWILVPGAIAGVLLGWAEQVRQGNMASLLDDGIGGGAIAIPLLGMAGGYALSGRGPTGARIVCGVVALAPMPIWALTATAIFDGTALNTPRGAWIAVFVYSYLAVLMLACSIPHRPVVQREEEGE